jgi:hypothetical protein
MFRRKLKRENRKSKRNKKYIITFCVIIVILFVCISVGYSLLSQKLDITGKASITNNEPEQNGDFDVKYTITDYWYNNFRHYYNISFNVINNDVVSTTGWEVSMDVPSDVSNVDCWNASSKVISKRVYFTNLSYNAVINPNNLEEVGFILNTGVNDSYVPTNIIVKIYTSQYPNGIEIKIGDTTIPEDPEDPDEPQLSQYIEVTFVLTDTWMEGNEYVNQYDVKISNIFNKKVTSWEIEIGNVNEFSISSIWNANYILTDTMVRFSNMSYNNIIKPGKSIQFGCQLKSNVQNYIPRILSTKATI